MKKLISTLITLLLISCGNEGRLEKPKDYKRPNFDNVVFDE